MIKEYHAGGEPSAGNTPPKPNRDAAIAKAVMLASMATGFAITDGIIPPDEAYNALQGLAQAFKVIAEREYPEWARTRMVDKITDRVLEIKTKIASGELPGGPG